MLVLLKKYYKLILICSLAVIIIGFLTSNSVTKEKIYLKENKLSLILHHIQQYYVDSIDTSHLAELAISKLVAELDPHSFYNSIPNSNMPYDYITPAPIKVSGVDIYWVYLTTNNDHQLTIHFNGTT